MVNLEEDYAIGLDLGTTFSCIGVYRNGKVEIIPNKLGDNITPSIVIIGEDLDILVGEETTDFLVKKYDSCIYETKRLIGRKFSDKEVTEEMKKLSFKIIKSNIDESPKIEIMNNGVPLSYYPVEIASFIIKKMVQSAENYLNTNISKLVITVPAYFNDSQRKLTKQAAELAGIKVLRVINEPTAAALAYGFDKKLEHNEKILVFDLGGGTFDVSIISLIKDENNIGQKVFQVLGTSGDMQLGGKDFDNKLVEFFLNKMDNKEEIQEDKQYMKKLKISCEKIKKDLSNSTEATLTISEFKKPNNNIIFEIKRIEFEDICKDLFDKIDISLNNALINAKLTRNEIDDVILVGGSTKIPKILEKLKQYFPKSNINNSQNADEAVAYGATLEAEKIIHNKKDSIHNFLLRDVIPLSLGTNIINKSTNPKILKEGDVMSIILKKGTPMNFSNSLTYYTVSDNQKEMSIDIYEGENAFVKYNHLLKRSKISNLKERKKGKTKVIVTFQIDINGILIVNAKEESEDNNGQTMKPIIIKNDEISLSEEKMKSLENKNKELLQKIGNNDNIKIEDYSNLKESLIKYKNAYIKAKNKYGNKKELKESKEEEEEEKETQDNRLIYISNFNETLEEFIDSYDIDNCDNETVIEKYYLYIKELLLSYIETLKFDLKIKVKKKIIEKIKEYINKFINKNSDYIKDLLEIFYHELEKEKEMEQKDQLNNIFYHIVLFVMEKYNDLGKKYIESNEKYCKYYSLINYEHAKIYFEKYLSKINSAILKKNDMQNYEKQKNIFEENIRDINSGAIVLCNESFKGGYLFGEDLIGKGTCTTNEKMLLSVGDLVKKIETYKIVLKQYEKILSEIQNSFEFNKNTKKEAICLANIIKINEKLKQLDENKTTLLRYANRCNYIIKDLIKKNNGVNKFEKEKWYIEFNNLYKILKEKEPKYEEYHELYEKLRKIQQKDKDQKTYSEKFDEFEEKFNKRKSNIDFINFIFKNDAYEGLEKDKKNRGEDFFKKYSRELVNFLLDKYHPDNYDNYKTSGNEEIEYKYCIIHDIYRKLNYLYITP